MTQSGESTHWTALASVEVAFRDVNVGIWKGREAAVIRVREMMMMNRK